MCGLVSVRAVLHHVVVAGEHDNWLQDIVVGFITAGKGNPPYRRFREPMHVNVVRMHVHIGVDHESSRIKALGLDLADASTV